MPKQSWEILTTRNARDGLPKINDSIVVDGIPADVIQVHVFHGIQYQVTIPGLIVDGRQRFIVDWIPWDIVLKIENTTPTDDPIDL